MQTSKILAGAIWVLCAQSVYAGQVNNLTTFTPNTPAKAAEVNGNFGAVKSAVDDNDARINASTSTINNHEARIKDLEQKAAAPVGMLVDQFSSNVDVTQSPQPMKNYLPVGPRDTNNALQTISYPYNTRAFVQTRCSFDGDAAGQTLAHRVAVRDSSVHFGPQAYLGSTTPGANITVQDINSDYFELVANVPYDFGVYFLPTPKNGTGNDRCSIMVMVFRP